MRIPCRLHQSRHGVYYYRYQFSSCGKRKEQRFSLQTKNPVQAKEKALLISAMIVRNKVGREMNQNEKETLNHILSMNAKEMEEQLKQLEIVVATPNGGSITMKADPNNPADLAAMLQASKDFWKSDIAESLMSTPSDSQMLPKQAVNTVVQPRQDTADVVVVAGANLPELIERFATRRKNTLAPKTLYEYRNYQQIFADWIAVRKKTPHFPIHDISRKDVSVFIDELLEKGLSNKTIQQKYLSAITNLFEVAKSSGSWNENLQFPTRGHKLFTKKDAKKANSKDSWKPFSASELKNIFNPDTYLKQKNPTDFWLPFLGLFTGGRISELCQLMIQDIKQIDGVWAIAITDEDECQRLKTPAAKRTVPVHPRLIEVGFLDFVKDMESLGGMLFPYLNPNAFGNFSETPSERFGKYLDSIKLTDSRKVFHSFRSTSNNYLKQNKVTEETRCQFIGHEHETTNSKVYSSDHSVAYLLENVAHKLDFDLPFKDLHYPRELILKTTKSKLAQKASWLKHKQARELRKTS